MGYIMICDLAEYVLSELQAAAADFAAGFRGNTRNGWEQVPPLGVQHNEAQPT